MTFRPFRFEFVPEKFELLALKFVPSAFLSEGYLELLSSNGVEKRIPLSQIADESPINWVVDPNATCVNVSITGFSIVCGECEGDTSKAYVVTISGAKDKIDKLAKYILKERGFEVVE